MRTKRKMRTIDGAARIPVAFIWANSGKLLGVRLLENDGLATTTVPASDIVETEFAEVVMMMLEGTPSEFAEAL